jgi:hypothetical protein
MTQEKLNILASEKPDKLLELKAEFMNEIVRKLISDFVKNYPQINQFNQHQVDSKLFYSKSTLDKIKRTLLFRDKQFILDVCKKYSNQLDYSQILKYVLSAKKYKDESESEQQYGLKLELDDKNLSILTEYIYSNFEKVIEESTNKFTNTPDQILTKLIQDVHTEFNNLLCKITIEKFGILNVALEIKLKPVELKDIYIKLKDIRLHIIP